MPSRQGRFRLCRDRRGPFGGRRCNRCRRLGLLLSRYLHLAVAVCLHLGQALVLLVRADGDELDHLLGHTQAALQLGDERAVGRDVQQDILTVKKLADGVSQTPAAELLNVADFAAAIGDHGIEAFNQLLEIRLFHVRTDDIHHFISTIHVLLFLRVSNSHLRKEGMEHSE